MVHHDVVPSPLVRVAPRNAFHVVPYCARCGTFRSAFDNIELSMVIGYIVSWDLTPNSMYQARVSSNKQFFPLSYSQVVFPDIC